jgi:uracil-DNA glycosylase family 4
MTAADHLYLTPSRVATQILGCRSCELRSTQHHPVPFRGPSPNALMILGEAPGFNEMKENRPFVGEGGQLLAHMLKGAELPPIEQWFVANTICCRPPKGAPSREEMKACEPNLRAQLKLCNPEWVLALGNTALQAIGATKSKIGEVRGRPFKARFGPFIDRWIMSTYHPGAVAKSPHYSNIIADDLVTMRRIISGEMDPKGVVAEMGRNGKIRKGTGYL